MLESFIIGRNMGKSGDPEMKEKLLKFKQNLTSELANQSSIKGTNPGLQMRANLEMNDFENALLGAKQMNHEYFSLIGMEVDKKINYLISLCGNMQGMFDVNSIRSNKMATAENVKVEESSKVNIDIEKLTVNPVECPISMDVDVPQILVNECQPILAGLDKSITDDIISCPLRILNYPEVVDKLKKSISRWVGTQTDGKLKSNPYTRQNLLGTIPLGTCQQHVDCGNYTISRLFTSGKLLGNLDLYWAVIWYLIKQNTWDFLTDITVQASEHLCYRLKTSWTFASLTGLPQFMITKVPSDVAIWYYVNSVLLDPPTDRDTTRLHVFNIDVMLAILEELKYPVSDKTLKYINRTKVLMSMLSMVKKNNAQFRNKISCLVQNAVRINLDNVSKHVKELEGEIRWIPIDGPASLEQVEEILCSFPSFFRNLTVDELYGLSTMVDRQYSASDIVLKSDWEPTPSGSVVNWTTYGLNEQITNIVPICPGTLRPYYLIDNKMWVDKLCEVYNIPRQLYVDGSNNTPFCNEIFSGYKMWGNFVLKYKEYPTIDSYLLFCYNRYSKSTLPFHVKYWAQNVIETYEPIVKDMKPINASRLFENGTSTSKRFEMEMEYKRTMK